ncbi:MAG: hypothetical protein AAGF23_21930 [Acidobacteriota bacterium]
MLGLGDEASDDFAKVGEPVQNPEYAALVYWYTGHVLLRVDDESIMSRGNTVRPWHYAPFLEVLERITESSEWRVVSSKSSASQSGQPLPGPAPSWTHKRPKPQEKIEAQAPNGTEAPPQPEGPL